MKRLLGGLDVLNGTQLSDDERSDYRKIHNGVHAYLQTQDELTGDEERDKLLIEGISYSLYSKTGFPKSTGIKLSGLRCCHFNINLPSRFLLTEYLYPASWTIYSKCPIRTFVASYFRSTIRTINPNRNYVFKVHVITSNYM